MLDTLWSAMRDKYYKSVPLFDIAKEFQVNAPRIQAFFKAYESYLLGSESEPNPQTIKYAVDEQAVKNAYVAGLPKTDISLFYGPCRTRINRILKNAGIVERDRDEVNKRVWVKRKKRPNPYDKLPWDMIEKDFGLGKSATQIAHDLKISPDTLFKQMEKRGIELPDRSESQKMRYIYLFKEKLKAVDWKSLKERYEKGEASLNDFARETGLARGRISKKFKEMGIKTHSFREGSRLFLDRKSVAENVDWFKIVLEYEQGASSNELAIKYKLQGRHIRCRLAKMGVALRKPFETLILKNRRNKPLTALSA